jgi:hypothetical protein
VNFVVQYPFNAFLLEHCHPLHRQVRIHCLGLFYLNKIVFLLTFVRDVVVAQTK